MGTETQKVIGPSMFHRTVDGMELVKAREGLFINQQVFAHRCGWSKQYQSQIEAPGSHEITLDTAKLIEKAIAKKSEIEMKRKNFNYGLVLTFLSGIVFWLALIAYICKPQAEEYMMADPNFVWNFDPNIGECYLMSWIVPDTNKALGWIAESKAKHKADIHLELDGVTKEFTIAEFKSKLGFEDESLAIDPNYYDIR